MGTRLTVPASESRGLQGEWLLEFVADGRVFRYATRQLDVDGLVFSGGLSPFRRSLGRASDQQAVEVFDASVDWAALELTGLEFEQAACRLWWWYPGQTLDQALHVMTGLAENVEHSDPQAPARIVFTVNSALRPQLYPVPSRTLDDSTWTVDDGTGTTATIGEGAIGSVAPTVIGYPGSGDAPVTRTFPYAAVPVPMVDCDQLSGVSGTKLLLSPGPIDAATVLITDSDDPSGPQGGGQQEQLEVERTNDLLGQPYSYAWFDDTAGYVITPWPTHKYFAGFQNDTGWGGGIFYGGSVLRGLGDVLAWALDQSKVNADLGTQRGEAERLNDFALDTYLDQPGLNLIAWIETTLVPLFPLRRLRLGNGLWYRLENWLATKVDAVARLDAVIGNVVRVSPKRRLAGPVANRVTLKYKRNPLNGEFRAVRILDGAAEPRPVLGQDTMWIPTGEDPRVVGSPYIAASQAKYGILDAPPIETTLLWSDSTAALALQFIAARDALPKEGITYEGRQLDRLLPGDVVVLHDPAAGVHERVALVDDIVVGGPVVDVDLVLLPAVERA